MTNLNFFSFSDQPVSLELLMQNDLDQYCHLATMLSHEILAEVKLFNVIGLLTFYC